MKNKALISLLFFSLLMAGMFSSVKQVQAVSYYNWISNPSFLTYSNYVELGSFENNAWSEGTVYGNFTQESSGAFSADFPYTGVYGLYFPTTNDGFMYNLTGDYTDVLGADIVEVSWWSKKTHQYYVWIHYSDASYDYQSYHPALTDNVWGQCDITQYIDDAKFVSYIIVEANGAPQYIDDFVILVDDGDGQDSIDGNSEPWWNEYFVSNPLYSDFGGLNSTDGRSDDNSGYVNHYDTSYLAQGIGYLEVDNVQYVNCYVYSELGSALDIRVVVKYADGTYSTRVKEYDCDSTWTEINFGKSFLEEGKIIYEIWFGVEGDTIPYDGAYGGYQTNFGGMVQFDDCGLWASVPPTYSKFDYVLSPTYVSRYGYQFTVYTGVQYTMTGMFYNSTGGLSDNGTVAITDAKGTQNTTMVDGLFTYLMASRSYTSAYTQEYIVIQVRTDDDELVIIQLHATFQYTSGGSSSGSDGTVVNQQTVGFLTMFLCGFLPSVIIASVTKSYSMFFLGLTFTSGYGWTVGVFPPWVVALAFMGFVLILFAGRRGDRL